MAWNNLIKIVIWSTIIQQCWGICKNITMEKEEYPDAPFHIEICEKCKIHNQHINNYRPDYVLAIDCSYGDFTLLQEKAENNSAFKFLYKELTLEYGKEMCYEINEVQRNLNPLFPDLEKLKINNHKNSCPTSNMINCPPNLKSVILNDLKDDILPKICQPQITNLDCHSCKNLKDISNVSQMENLEILKIDGANLTKLEGNFFEKNKNLQKLHLRKCKIKNVYNNSLNGLMNLEDIVLEGNPIMEIPSGFFAPAVNLQYIQWTDDYCFENERTWPNNLLSNANVKVKKFTYKPFATFTQNGKLLISCIFHLNAKAFSSSQYDSIEYLDLKYTKLDSSVFEDFVFKFKNLETLDLSNNYLEKITVNLTNELRNLSRLKISGNPKLSCECATIQNLEYLHSVGKIQDNDYKTECYRDGKYKGKYNFKDEDIKAMKDIVHEIDKRCREDEHSIRNVVIICSSILGALLFVCLCFFGWVYRCHIKHLYEKFMTVLYHHELFKKMFSKEKQSYLHDVLLLCHDENLNLLQIIFENLKNINSGYNIAFKENDFRGGYSEQEECTRLMNESQCIIIILSTTYLDTYECCEELINANKDFYKRLILIRLENLQELMNDRTDDQALKIHKILKKVPSLKFDENPKAFFWKFLEYKMPHIKLSKSLTMSTIVNTSNGV